MPRSLAALFVLVLCPAICRGQEARDPELTVSAAKTALEGWELFQAGKFVAAGQGGRYTDPNPKTQVRDFWSNSRWAMLDRDSNGHHETIFLVEDNQLVYLGCLDQRGTLVNPARRFTPHAGKTRDEVVRNLRLE